jgi:hypothetical protein
VYRFKVFESFPNSQLYGTWFALSMGSNRIHQGLWIADGPNGKSIRIHQFLLLEDRIVDSGWHPTENQ